MAGRGSTPRVGRFGLGLLALLWAMPAPVYPADCIDLLYFERPPYYRREASGQVGGLVGGRVRDAFDAAGICYRWVRLPANRHLARVRGAHTPVCAVGWFKTPERERFAKFSAPIYQDRSIIALARVAAGLKEHYGSVAELLKRRDWVLGRRAGFSYGARLDAEIASWKPRIYTSTRTDRALIEMLRRKRIDYVFMAREEADLLLRQNAQGVVRIAFDDLSPGNRRYLLCARAVSDRRLAALDAYFLHGGPD